MIREDRVVSLFLDLCNINSPALKESECVAYAKKVLFDTGLEVHEDEAGGKFGGNANNLIAVLPGNLPKAPRIFLSAHFDTVEPTEDLVISEKEGVFYSLSDTILGADDKAGIASAIEAVRAVKEANIPHGDILLFLTVSEEIGLKGASELEIDKWKPDFGYVLDTGPPVGSFVTRTATHDKLDFTIIGKPAHAGKDPEKGINAIQVASAAINGMRLGRIAEETTANIGIIEGGTAVNVVCPKVIVRAEARSTSLEELETQTSHMIQRFEEAAREWNVEVEVEHSRHYYSYHIPENEPVVAHAVKASLALGYEPVLRTTLGGSDANVFNAKGIPTIVVATGMQQIHTHEESVSRQSLVEVANLVYEIVGSVAKDSTASDR
jgi:tripeptide aminopeptidase